MTDVLLSALSIAADTGPGRGDDPGTGSGIVIIVAIVLAVAVGAFVMHALFHRFGRSRSRAMERRPAREGRVGRISEFRDR